MKPVTKKQNNRILQNYSTLKYVSRKHTHTEQKLTIEGASARRSEIVYIYRHTTERESHESSTNIQMFFVVQ